jgi:hypothetical protein
MTNDRSCPCRPGVLTVTSTGITPFRKLKPSGLFLSLALVFAVILFANAPAAMAQAHTTGLNVTKTVNPPSSQQGTTVTVTVTVENQDVAHGVKNLTITNTVPFPGGTTTPVVGCETNLAASDGVPGQGPDFTSCSFQETIPITCDSTNTNVTDQINASGLDNAPGTIFDNLPVSGSASNTVIATPLTCNDDKECTDDACVPDQGCVFTNKADSTACTDTVSGDCKIAGCEAGVCVQTHTNAADSTACTTTADVAGDCGTPGCEAGVCVANHIPVADSTACSVGVTGTPSECATPGCESGVCVATHIPKSDSTACTDTTPGDCKTAGCESGVCVQTHGNVADSTACSSTPDVEGDCGTPGCEAGVCVANHVPVSDSTPCSVGVTGSPDECKTPGCESGVCVAAHINKADSTACTDTTPECGFTAGCEAGSCVQDHAPQDCGGNQGCTPGFWKANADKKQANAWPTNPNTLLGTVFTIPPCLSGCSQNFANLTLRQALSLQGGNSLCEKAEILLRIATGAYLNSLSTCVQFPVSTGALVAEVNGILASCDASQFTTESTKLDGFNNLGCPLNQQGQCSNP